MINAVFRMAASQPGLTLVVALCACAPAAQPSAASSPAPRSASAETADSVRRSYTRADVDFMTHMIGHHAQAIVMGRMAPTRAASPSIRILAERIINAQQDEIETMQRWLRRRQLAMPEAEPDGMIRQEHEHGPQMPGMLSVDQMRELDAARGHAFDRLFLTYMIQHHQGALTMVDQLFDSHGAAQEETIFKFASDVSADQSTEIARMRSMLTTLPETSTAR
jgi:uncharacterized protein (DUF305 family)